MAHTPIRSAGGKIAPPAWLSGLGVDGCCFTQRLVPEPRAEADPVQSSSQPHAAAGPMRRGLFASAPLRRGDVIARIPTRSILNGSTAVEYLRREFPDGLKSVLDLTTDIERTYSFERGLLQVQAASREPFDEVKATNGASNVGGVPRSETGAVLRQRQLEKESPSASVPANGSGQELGLPLITRDGLCMLTTIAVARLLKALQPGRPRTPMERWIDSWPTTAPAIGAILREAARMEPTLLTLMYQNSAEGIQTRDDSPRRRNQLAQAYAEAVKSVTQIDETTREVLIHPLTEMVLKHSNRLVGAGNSGTHLGEAQTTGVLTWAYFMLRSRSCRVGGHSERQRGQLGIIPCVDMLNHGRPGANVTYFVPTDSSATDQGTVSVVATKPIPEGAELLLDYGEVIQRGLLFGYDFPTPMSVSSKEYQARTPQTITLESRHQVLDGTQLPPSKESEEAQLRIASNHPRWIWMYGFVKDAKEREYDASCRWSVTLMNRLKEVADTRFKGKKGTFMTGVPEGLQHLRAARARVREHYGGANPFPQSPDERLATSSSRREALEPPTTGGQ
jgi:hypothetical protein